MTRTVEQKLKRAKQVSRRITREEKIESGLAALDRAGLLEAAEEWAATHICADGTTMTAEDIALSLASVGRYSVTSITNSKDIKTKGEDRLVNLQDKLDQIHELITEQQSSSLSKDWYTPLEVADLLNKAPFTVREWCRLGRVNVRKRPTGRGDSKEWEISHEEVERIRNHGLLPPKY